MSQEPLLIREIICPRCRAELPLGEDVCPRCGASLSGAPNQPPRRRFIERPWVVAIILLHLGLLAIPLLWKMRYSTKTRIALCITSVVYTVVALAIIYWAILQIIHAVSVLSS